MANILTIYDDVVELKLSDFNKQDLHKGTIDQ